MKVFRFSFGATADDGLAVRRRPQPPAHDDRAWHALVKRRALVVCVVLGVWGVSIQARLVQLQVVRHDAYVAKSEAQEQSTVKIAPKRGDITDRDGALLASSVDRQRIDADPSLIDEPAEAVDQLCGALADCSAAERLHLLEQFSRDVRWVRVRDSAGLSLAQVQALKPLDLPWLIFATESVRVYPNQRLASHVLGFVGDDNLGLLGIESLKDAEIRGQGGLLWMRRDAKGTRVLTTVEQEATAGATIELTLDREFQHIAERELFAGVSAANALAGTAIIMDSATGELLGLANYPDFDPNVFAEFSPDSWRNRAVQEVYEPGSTFKPFTASAALESKLVSPQTLVDVGSGYLRIPGRSRAIVDDHPAGRDLTFEDVIVKSSNVGAATIGLQVGPERMSRYARRFGFGELLTTDFAGQSRGILFPAEELNDSALASMSMGYQVAVTPLQMVTAINAIANDGVLMEPHIVRAIIRDGVREEVEPRVVRRAITSETASTVTSFMENVVNRGTATAAALDRYQVAGKTGTAKKAVPDGYSDTARVASLVGFVPSVRPEFTILVVIDTPRNGSVYGGTVAGPVFKRIAEAILSLSGVTPTVDPEPPFVLPAQRAVDGAAAIDLVQRAPAPRAAVIDDSTSPSDAMPDVRGLSWAQAVGILHRAGLEVEVKGSGSVVEQTPAAGARISGGAKSVIVLERRRLPPRAGGGTR